MAGKINSMTESGLLAAVTVIMALIAVYVPILGIAAVILWPLPMIVLIVRHGIRWGVMAAVVAGVLTAILVEPMIALRLLIAFAPGGIALGIGYRKKLSGTNVFLMGLAVSMVSKALALGLAFWVTGIHPFAMQFDMMDQSFEKSVEMYQSMNMTPEQIAAARENFTANMAMVRQLLPLVVILMGVLDTAVNFIVGSKVLKRLGNEVAMFPPFIEWRLSSFFAYLYGFSIIGMYWGSTRSVALLYQVSFNANMLATMAGILQGLVIYECVMKRFNISKILNTVLLVFIFFNGVLLQILSFVGIFDMVFDYRKRSGMKY